MSENFSIKTRLTARRCHSTPEPEIVVKGYAPIVVVTFPNVGEDTDEMVVDVDATGFDVEQLSALFTSLAATLTEGKKVAEATGKAGQDVDWEGLEKSAEQQ